MRMSRGEAGLIVFLILFVGFLTMRAAQPYALDQVRRSLVGAGYVDPIITHAPPTEACPQHNFRYVVLRPYFETGTICAGTLFALPVISPGVRMKGAVS